MWSGTRIMRLHTCSFDPLHAVNGSAGGSTHAWNRRGGPVSLRT